MTGIKIKISNNHTISIINSKVQNTTNKIGKLQIETYTIQIGKKYNTNTKLFNTNRKIIHFIWKLQQCKWKRSNFVVFIISSGIKFRRFVNNNSFLDTWFTRDRTLQTIMCQSAPVNTAPYIPLFTYSRAHRTDMNSLNSNDWCR